MIGFEVKFSILKCHKAVWELQEEELYVGAENMKSNAIEEVWDVLKAMVLNLGNQQQVKTLLLY